jgi:hypothetical protein
MKARLFGTIALVMLPTFAFAIDAGKTAGSTNETTPTSQTDKMKPDDAKAAGTGGGKGAANATSTDNGNDRGSGNVGANGAAAATATAPKNDPISPDKATAAGTGGGEGAKTTEPNKTP